MVTIRVPADWIFAIALAPTRTSGANLVTFLLRCFTSGLKAGQVCVDVDACASWRAFLAAPTLWSLHTRSPGRYLVSRC